MKSVEDSGVYEPFTTTVVVFSIKPRESLASPLSPTLAGSLFNRPDFSASSSAQHHRIIFDNADFSVLSLRYRIFAHMEGRLHQLQREAL